MWKKTSKYVSIIVTVVLIGWRLYKYFNLEPWVLDNAKKVSGEAEKLFSKVKKVLSKTGKELEKEIEIAIKK